MADKDCRQRGGVPTRKLGRPSWSTIFVEADLAGEIRQGWPTRTVDKEGASRPENLVVHPRRQSLSRPTSQVRFDKDGRQGLSTKRGRPDQKTWSSILVDNLCRGRPRR